MEHNRLFEIISVLFYINLTRGTSSENAQQNWILISEDDTLFKADKYIVKHSKSVRNYSDKLIHSAERLNENITNIITLERLSIQWQSLK